MGRKHEAGYHERGGACHVLAATHASPELFMSTMQVSSVPMLIALICESSKLPAPSPSGTASGSACTVPFSSPLHGRG